MPSLLLELVRKELVLPGRSDFMEEEAFEFRHLLIRDAAYDALSKESRADLHAHFADWLESRAGDRLGEYAEIVGWHLEQAHRYLSELGPIDERGEELARRAADRLAGAGWAASARGDTYAGVKLRARALALMVSGDPRRPQLLGDLGDALLWAGRFDEADRALAEAIELAEAAGDERTRVRSRLSQLRLRFQVDPDVDYAEARGRRDQDGGALRGARRRLRRGPLVASRELGSVRPLSARGDARAGGARVRVRPPRQGPALPAGRPDRRARLDYVRADARLPGVGGGAEILERVRGHRGAEAYALCFLGQLRGMLGQRDAAREMILKGVADRQVLGDLPGAAMSRGEGLGYFVEMVRGDWQTAEQELRRAYDELSSMGDKSYLALTAGWLAHCLYALGRYEEADECATVSEGPPPGAGSPPRSRGEGRGRSCSRAGAPRRGERRSRGRRSISPSGPTGPTRRPRRSWISPRCSGWAAAGRRPCRSWRTRSGAGSARRSSGCRPSAGVPRAAGAGCCGRRDLTA